jgi:hypothetical protein
MKSDEYTNTKTQKPVGVSLGGGLEAVEDCFVWLGGTAAGGSKELGFPIPDHTSMWRHPASTALPHLLLLCGVLAWPLSSTGSSTDFLDALVERATEPGKDGRRGDSGTGTRTRINDSGDQSGGTTFPACPPPRSFSHSASFCPMSTVDHYSAVPTLDHFAQGFKRTGTSTMRWGTFPRRSAQTPRTLQTTFSSVTHSSWTTGEPRRRPSRSTYSTSSLTCATP